MPQADVDGLRINYDVQGEGEPLLLIPYLSADHACYAFQLPAYTEHFSCIAVDLPGSGESDKPAGPYATDAYADQLAGFLGAIGVESAHVAGVSLGASVGMHLAARHPERVRSLSLHSAWDRSDAFLRAVVEMWRALAGALPTVADAVIARDLPVLLHARDVRRAAGVRPGARRLRARPPGAASGCLPGPDRGGARARRQCRCSVRSRRRRSSPSARTTSSHRRGSPSGSPGRSPAAS